MNRYLIAVLIILFSSQICFSKDKNAEKNEQKKIEREIEKFKKNMDNKPNDPKIYWNHANNIAGFKALYRDSKYFYEKALKLDSTNGLIFKDYGMYLYRRLYLLDEAKAALSMAINLKVNDDEINKCIISVDKAIENRELEAKLRNFGHTKTRYYDTTISYASITNFDSLRKLTVQNGNVFNYELLLNKFLADDINLTPQEMYMLILGYSNHKYYNPFNYNDISTLKALTKYNLDSAISKGNKLIPENPLNPSINRELMYCYRKKNEPEMADKYAKRIQHFFSGMLYSGTGTCERPYVSLWSKEEYNFINYIGYQQTENHSMETCAGQMAEMMDMLNPETQAIEKINFNVKLIYLQTVGK